ncbi:hypothetical protein GMES_3686 [Paraglaciecola mesophila KMM 241]|uniref:Uncharacterized protein n=1 Tax=Paraglaciecola mesophila KMM 241 TaxID=1128912 RepID=K6ZAG5_9ALTE|nr:hypothetical protein GMES_3686 [Paraglaciecola mesophila KMM 241]
MQHFTLPHTPILYWVSRQFGLAGKFVHLSNNIQPIKKRAT